MKMATRSPGAMPRAVSAAALTLLLLAAVEQRLDTTERLARAIVGLDRPNLYDLFALHAQARGARWTLRFPSLLPFLFPRRSKLQLKPEFGWKNADSLLIQGKEA
jgi:hypothetical protein